MNEEKIRFSILRETGRNGVLKNIDQSKFETLDLGFTWDKFVEEVRFLNRRDYITKPLYVCDTVYLFDSVLTEKGDEYLENNKWYKKAYTAAKEIRDWVK